MLIRGVIMAGGNGTRLRPLTCDVPKPMVPIVNRPVMSYTVDLLKKHGIRDIAVTLAYLPGKIRDYYGTGADFAVNFEYFVEESPLGTAGSVKNAEAFLRDTFIVISGDALTDLNIQEAVAFHRERKACATLVLHRQPVPLEYGVVITDEDGRITRFLEKPSWGEVFSDTVNTGIYILEPAVLEYIPAGQPFDFSKDLFPRLLADGLPLYGYIWPGYWCDIGDLRSYRQANFDVLAGRVQVQIAAGEMAPGIWVEAGARIDDGADIRPPVYIGRGCKIGPGAYLGQYTVLGDNCTVEAGTSLKRTVVWKNTRWGRHCEGRGATVCDRVSIADGARLFEDAVVGSASILEEGVTLRPGVKVWPGKTIAQETEVSGHLVWADRKSRSLFGRRDVSGLFNVEVTPEFASRLGSAFAALAGEKESFVVGADNTEAAALIADSLIAGILACGCRVIRASGLVAPITRFGVTHYDAWGGIHVRLDAQDNNRVRLEFFDARGVCLPRSLERKLEAAFNSDDFQRVEAQDVELAERSTDLLRVYFARAAAGLEVLGRGKAGPRVAAGAETELMHFLGSSFLARAGCRVVHGGNTAAAVSQAVVDNAADLGVFFRADGEEIILFDARGIPVPEENYQVLATWIALQFEGKHIVVPHNASQAVRDMARGAGVVPVKSAPGEMMAAMQEYGREDRRVALQFLLNFDGIQAAARIIDYLAARGVDLDQLLAEIPRLHFRKVTVPCQWGDKGRVLRELIARHRQGQIQLEEGVKVLGDKGWALVLPDSEKPQFNVYAQGYSEEYAEELAAEFTDNILSLLRRSGEKTLRG